MLTVLLDAAAGTFPPVDGEVVFMPPLRAGREAVLSLTGRAYVATRLSEGDFAELPLDGFGAALAPGVLACLAGTHGEVGVVDATLVAFGVDGGGLPARCDLDGHPRVRHARALREDVRVYGDGRGLVTIARGLAGRAELSVETRSGSQERGAGRGLIRVVRPTRSRMSSASQILPMSRRTAAGKAGCLDELLDAARHQDLRERSRHRPSGSKQSG